MAASKVQIVLKTADATPANYISNSFCIEHGVKPDGAEVMAAFKSAYDMIGATYWSQALSQTGHTIKITDAIGTPPLYPWFEDTWSLAIAPSGGYLPSEVALCISFQGTRTSGLTQKRRRGRIYLGPLGSSSLDGTGRPATGLLQDCEDFSRELYDELRALTQPGCFWAVWSPTDSDSVEVVNGWVDNEYDTQRRRGRKATVRETFVFP